jgi:CHAT domain-containing protein/tetratricopeptide (TPR) repeat protein
VSAAVAPDPQAIARRWLDHAGADAQATALEPAQRRAVAWALKDLGYEALQRDPHIVQRALLRLDTLAADGDTEIAALAAWVHGALLIVQGRMAEAIAQLDGAAARFAALGREQAAAEVQVPKLIALSMLGRHDEAVACAQRTRAQFVAAGDERSAGKVELNLGSMLLRLDRYDEAARFYRQAAVRFARVRDTQHSIMADIGLATVLTWQFEFDEALRIYERAAMRVRAHALPMLQGLIDLNRGRLELHRGRHRNALQRLEAALREIEALGSPQLLAEARRHLADAYLALNLLPEAATLYEQAIRASREFGAPVEQAWATVQLALARARQGQAAQAAQGFAEARALFEAQRNKVGMAWVDLHAATLELAGGDATAAHARAESALAAFATAGIASWRHEAELLLAASLAASESMDAARRRYEQVLQAALDLPEIAAACRMGLGALLRRGGDTAGARAQFEQAARAIETQRAALPGDEFRIAYGADKQAPYDALLDMAIEDPAAQGAARLLECMERARAHALRLGVRQALDGAAGDGAATPPLRESLRWLNDQWQEAITAGQGARATQLLDRVRAIEAQWLEQQRRAQARTATGPAAAPPEAAFEVGALQAALPDDTALVEFALVDERLAACVVTRGTLHRVHWAAPGLEERIGQLRFQIDSLRFGAPALRAHAQQIAARARHHLQALHAMIWQTLAHLVRDCERIVVVPHRCLHYVPFCALHDGAAWLVERHAIELAPSAALWLAGADAHPAPTTPTPPRVLALGLGSTALPHVAAEVHAVAAAFDGRATVLLDGAATQPALRAVLPGTDVLHLACHGRFRADSPYFSALQLADGALTLRDAAALPLRGTQLVTLSACETGLSRVAPGDDLLGLVRGFLLAGTQRVLATLWTVDDASTAALMGGFYGRFAAGEGAARALRAAQRDLLAEQPHPYHWAPFALHGRA